MKGGGVRSRGGACPAMVAGVMAAQKGVPFIPMRGLIGSDILRTRPDWTVIENPYKKDDPIVAIPAVRPDVCLFHSPEADPLRNVPRVRLALISFPLSTSLLPRLTLEPIR